MSKSRKYAVLKQLRELRSDLVEKLKTKPRDKELTDMLRIVQGEIRDITPMAEECFLPKYQKYYAHIATAILILLFSITGFAQTPTCPVGRPTCPVGRDTTYTLPQLPALVRTPLDYGLGNPFKFEVLKLNQCGELELTSRGFIRGISVSTPVREAGTYFVRLLHPTRPQTLRITVTPFDECEAGHYITIETCSK